MLQINILCFYALFTPLCLQGMFNKYLFVLIVIETPRWDLEVRLASPRGWSQPRPRLISTGIFGFPVNIQLILEWDTKKNFKWSKYLQRKTKATGWKQLQRHWREGEQSFQKFCQNPDKASSWPEYRQYFTNLSITFESYYWRRWHPANRHHRPTLLQKNKKKKKEGRMMAEPTGKIRRKMRRTRRRRRSGTRRRMAARRLMMRWTSVLASEDLMFFRYFPLLLFLGVRFEPDHHHNHTLQPEKNYHQATDCVPDSSNAVEVEEEVDDEQHSSGSVDEVWEHDDDGDDHRHYYYDNICRVPNRQRCLIVRCQIVLQSFFFRSCSMMISWMWN